MSSSDIHDFLECSVCLETLGRNHKVLPCQHTFCTPCLDDVRKKRRMQIRQGVTVTPNEFGTDLICPECRSPCPIHLEQLPSNVILNRILEGMKASSSNPNLRGWSSPAHQNSPGHHQISGNLTTNPFLDMLEESSQSESPAVALDRPHSTPPSTSQNSAHFSSPLTNNQLKSPVPVLPPKPVFFPSSGSGPTLPARPRPHPSPQSGSPTPSAGHQIYRALYDYAPVKPDELQLKKNELYIVIEKCQDGWFKGSAVKGLKTGVFPGNYVIHIQHQEILQPQKADPVKSKPVEPKRADPPRSSSDLIDLANDIGDAFVTQKNIVPPNRTTPQHNSLQQLQMKSAARMRVPTSNPLPQTTSSSSSRERYRCTMAFPGSSPYELDLKDGDVVILVKKREDGWCKGFIEGTEKVGLFPATFVTKIS